LFLFASHLESTAPRRAGLPPPAHAGALRRRGIQKVAELAEGDSGLEMQFLSGAIFTAG